MLENLPQRIFLKDRDSVYLSCNRHYASDLGIEPEEIAGKTDYDFYPKDLAEKYRADDKRIMESGQTEEIEEDYLQHGRKLVVNTVKTPLKDEKGNVVALLGIFWDITDRKRAEEAVRAKNRELESFVYTVSHDLRAPLVSLEGFARVLSDEYGDRLDADAQDYLARLRANVKTMNSLLDDLLELSRIGRAEEPRVPVEVGQVVAETLETLSGLIKQSGAQVTVADHLPVVRYSRVRLLQVFTNLISNAIKFSREKEVPHVEIGWQPTPDGYRFFVKDNGIGIPEKHQQRIFDIFSRLREKNVEGTGVGLAIVKRIVEKHEGVVGVDSAPGRGSTFWFTVPE